MNLIENPFSCIFIRYSPLHKGYRCLNPMTKHVYISKHLIFDETIVPFADSNSLSLLMHDASQIQEYPTYDEWLQYPSAAKISNTPLFLNSSPTLLAAAIPLDKIYYFSNVTQMPHTSNLQDMSKVIPHELLATSHNGLHATSGEPSNFSAYNYTKANHVQQGT